MAKTQVWVPRVIVQEQVVQQNHGHILSCPCGHGPRRKNFLGTFSDGVIVFSVFTGDQAISNTGNKITSRYMLQSLHRSRDSHQTRFNLDLGVKIIGRSQPLTPLESLALIWYEKEPWQLLVILPKNLELPKGASVFNSDFQTFLTAK